MISFDSTMAARRAAGIWFLLGMLAVNGASAQPMVAPGRAELRVDLQRLADDAIIRAPMTTWPLSWQSLLTDLDEADVALMDPETRSAFERVRTELRFSSQTHRALPYFRIGATSDPVAIRGFSSTPREDGELEAAVSYTGDRLSFNINLTRAIDAARDQWRLDGSWVGLALGNWSVVAGYPDRWWGPGMQGSLILSTNARPLKQIGIQRLSADGFEHPWLRWLGPWTVASFIGQFDDARTIDHALLFGMRMTARPLPQFEFGVSRTAQLCGDGRPCGSSEFLNMLIGRDNRGRNISAEAEPGNQLAGFDGRWSFRDMPYAVYFQWIGEDTRQGGPQIGSWMRMIGAERTGRVGDSAWQHRTYLELADTTCQEGGGGFGGNKFNCGYQHGTYRSGYRFEGRPLGYATDTDSESLSLISILNGPSNRTFEFGGYSVRVNQGLVAGGQPHALSGEPASRYGLEFAHSRDLKVGRLRVRLGFAEQRNQRTGVTDSDSSIAVEWQLGYW